MKNTFYFTFVFLFFSFAFANRIKNLDLKLSPVLKIEAQSQKTNVWPAVLVKTGNDIFIWGVEWGEIPTKTFGYKSSDSGQTWTSVSGPSWGDKDITYILSGATAPNGDLYLVGTINSSSSHRWVTWRSQDKSQTWTVVDDFQLKSGQRAIASEIAVDDKGAIFVAGQSLVSGNDYWIVRKSEDSGETWKTVDHLVGGEDRGVPRAVAIDSSNNVYVGGWWSSLEKDRKNVFTVRRGTSDGTSWTFSDLYRLSPFESTSLERLGISADDSVIAMGTAAKDGYRYCISRISFDKGQSWSNSELYGENLKECSYYSSASASENHHLIIGELITQDDIQKTFLSVNDSSGKPVFKFGHKENWFYDNLITIGSNQFLLTGSNTVYGGPSFEVLLLSE